MFSMGRKLLGLAMAVVFAAGCSQPLTKRETGALGGSALGAGTGAIIGSTTGHAGEGALIGGALGAVGGTVVGDQLQKQDEANAATQQQLDRQRAEIERNQQLIDELKQRNLDARASDRGVVVNLPDILFEFGKSSLTREARSKVNDIADILGHSGAGRKVSVEGHTDSIGTDSYNLKLSQERAMSVAMALESDGVNASRLTTKGLGKGQPIAPNRNPDGSDNPAGRARNRRVEVVILN